MAQKPKSLVKSHCNGCGRQTKHHLLSSRERIGQDYADGYGDISWTDRYEFLECAGCESISMRHIHWFEPTDETSITTYPPPVARRQPTWISDLPRDLKLLMRQVYAALDSDSRALAIMGARAVVDLVLVDQVGDVGGFGDKLRAAERTGALGKRNRQILEAALDAGNAAAHRGYQAKAGDVSAVLDIVENLLQAEYQLQSLAERLKRNTPARQAPPQRRTEGKKTS